MRHLWLVLTLVIAGCVEETPTEEPISTEPQPPFSAPAHLWKATPRGTSYEFHFDGTGRELSVALFRLHVQDDVTVVLDCISEEGACYAPSIVALIPDNPEASCGTVVTWHSGDYYDEPRHISAGWYVFAIAYNSDEGGLLAHFGEGVNRSVLDSPAQDMAAKVDRIWVSNEEHIGGDVGLNVSLEAEGRWFAFGRYEARGGAAVLAYPRIDAGYQAALDVVSCPTLEAGGSGPIQSDQEGQAVAVGTGGRPYVAFRMDTPGAVAGNTMVTGLVVAY